MHWVGAILAIGFLIVVHEAGHFVVARLCGMRVERFSIGFGPAIVGWRSKAGTLFQLAPIPFGGFVEIRGMNLAEDVNPTDHHAYPNRPAWQRFLTIFAGPATNYLTAMVLAFGLYSAVGVRSVERWYGVGDFTPDSAAAGKLELGDRILSVDGKKVWLSGPEGQTVKLTDIVNAVSTNHPNLPIDVEVLRNKKVVKVQITPRPGYSRFGLPVYNDGKRVFYLGIAIEQQYDYIDVGVLGAAREALIFPIAQTRNIVSGLYEWIAGRAEGEMHGPVGMAQIVKRTIQVGLIPVIELLMLLNVYLGLFNLFPLPALDGGRLAFLGYEMATRRRANPKIETTVHMIGILILVVVMVVVTFKDCAALR